MTTPFTSKPDNMAPATTTGFQTMPFPGIEAMPEAVAKQLTPLMASACSSGGPGSHEVDGEAACAGASEACDKAHELQAQDNAQHNWLYRSYWNALQFALGELGWTPMSILDVGCGDGTLLSWIARENRWAKLHAVDFSKDMVEVAQAKHPCRVQYKVVSQEYNLPYADNSMDVVVSHNILATHGDPLRVLREMTRVAKDTVIFSTLHPWLFKIIRHYPLTRFWHLNRREKAFYIQPENVTPEWLGDEPIRQTLAQAGYVVESTSSPFPFKLYLARHPERQKQSFQALETVVPVEGAACQLR